MIAALALGAVLSAEVGLSAGTTVVPFEPLHLTGYDAGSRICPVCQYFAFPLVFAFYEGGDPHTEAAAKKLDSAVMGETRAFLVDQNRRGKGVLDLVDPAKSLSERNGLESLALLALDPETTRDPILDLYRIPLDAEPTAIVYLALDRTVVDKFVAPSLAELDWAAIEAAIGELN